MSLVSVIMPAYNTEPYIASSIESVLNQTVADIELIIVNDGSTDNTLEIATQFAEKDKRVTVISQKNQGVSVARNKGLSIATGQFIAFLDSDDLYEHTFLEKLLNRIHEENCDIAYCGFKHIKFNDRKEGEPFSEGNMLSCYANHNQLVCTICVLIRHELIKKHNITFVPGRIMGEDQEFILQCGLYANKMSSVPEYLSIYRYNPSSVSNKISALSSGKKLKSDIDAREHILSLINKAYKNNDKEQIYHYFLNIKNNMIISFKKQLWTKLKQGEYQFVLDGIIGYGSLENLEEKRKTIHSIEVAIINSRNIFLWKMVATPLRLIKKLELFLKNKR